MIGLVTALRSPWRFVVASSLVLAAVHAAVVALPSPWDRAASIVLWAIVVMLALRLQLSLDELGLSPRAAPRGLMWGVVSVAMFAAVFGLLLAIPQSREFVNDLGTAAGSNVWLTALVLIPLRTVLLEEFVFRGFLWACLRRRTYSNQTVVLGTAVAFGMWHISPALSLADRSGTATGLALFGVLFFTTSAGVLFGYVRLKSDSLISSVLLHWIANASGVVAVYFV